MRTLFLALLWIFVSLPVIGHNQTLSLTDPEHARFIEFSINGRSSGIHYIMPASFTVKNISTGDVRVILENGLQLIPLNEKYQGLIVTKELVVDLLPGQQKTLPIYAMCTDAMRRAPNENTGYQPGQVAPEELLVITRLIEEKEHYSIEAQTAIWSIFGDRSPGQIAGFDTLMVNMLTEMLAETLDIDLPPEPAPDDYIRNYYVTEYFYEYKLSGYFRYELIKTNPILIAMFDKNNIVVRELYRNNACEPGRHELRFDFDAKHYTDEYYYVRLVENGEVMLELKVRTPEEVRQG